MAFKGPSVPSQPRTLRSQILKIGALPAGFGDATDVDYCAQGGHPVSPEHPGQCYVGKEPGVSADGAKAIQESTPFTIKK